MEETNRVQNTGERHDEAIFSRALHRLLQSFEQLIHRGPFSACRQAQKPLGPFSGGRSGGAGLTSGLRRFSCSRTAIASRRGWTTIVLTTRRAVLFAGRILLVVLASWWLLVVTAHAMLRIPPRSMIRLSDSLLFKIPHNCWGYIEREIIRPSGRYLSVWCDVYVAEWKIRRRLHLSDFESYREVRRNFILWKEENKQFCIELKFIINAKNVCFKCIIGMIHLNHLSHLRRYFHRKCEVS